MQYKITNEQPFQVLCSSFSISPSQQNYTLNISADGRNYSPLFTVASGQTRLVTGVASGSYYKLVGNQSEVTVNWVRSCNDGGGSGSGSTYTAGEYISIANDVISVTGITPDLYATTADTQAIEEHLNDVERVTASALTELHNDVLELSGATNDAFSAITETQQVAAAGLNSLQGQINTLSGNTYTKAEVDAEITGATSDMKTYTDNRIDGYDSAVTLTTASWNSYLRMDGSTVCTAGDIIWEALARPMFNTTNIQQYEIGNDPHDPGLGTVNYLKFNYVGETNNFGELTGVYYALPDNGEFVEGVPVQLTRTTSQPSTVYNTPAGTGSGYFIWDNVNLTITWNRQPVIVQHVPGVVKSDGEITKVKKLTQAEYDAITTPDASTLYIIVNN